MPDTTATPDTLAGIHARYREIAPTPDPESTDPSMAVAASLLVAAQRANTLLLTPCEPIDHNLINTMCAQFAVVHLLRWLRENHPVDAARLSWEINGAWEDGGGVGEWLWEHAQALGVDPEEVSRLAEAEAVLRAGKRGAETSAVAAPHGTRAEKAERACRTLGWVVDGMARSLYAAWIDIRQGDLKGAAEWVLNSIPDQDDNPPDRQWNGTETAQEWFDRTRPEPGQYAVRREPPAYARTPERSALLALVDAHFFGDGPYPLQLVCMTEDANDAECSTTVALVEPGTEWDSLEAKIGAHAAECHAPRTATLALPAAEDDDECDDPDCGHPDHYAHDEPATAAADAPLTHFFHCWRFPAHHACAVALIERQSEENDRQLVRAARAERELAEISREVGLNAK